MLPELRGLSIQEVIEDPMSLNLYRETYETLKLRLFVGYPVPDDIEVAIFGNSTLLETSFRLREMDRAPLEGTPNPGRSAHITFTRIPEIAILCQLGRPLKREDRLYLIPAPSFREIGFSPNYAPTNRRPLHIRLVPHRLDDNGDITQEDRIKLVALVQGHRIPRNYIPK